MQPSLRSSSCRRVKKIPCDDVKKVSVKQSSASSMYIFNMYLCTSLWILLNILFCRAKCSVYRWLCFFHRSFKSQLGGKSVKWCLYTYSTVDNLSCLCVPRKAWATVIISGLGVLGQFLSISRNAVTRDDVWLTHNSIAPCDVIETRKGYPAPHRKVRNI